MSTNQSSTNTTDRTAAPAPELTSNMATVLHQAAIRALVGTTDLDNFEPAVLAKKEAVRKAGRLGLVFKAVTAEAIEAQATSREVLAQTSGEFAARVAIRLAFVAALDAEHAKLEPVAAAGEGSNA